MFRDDSVACAVATASAAGRLFSPKRPFYSQQNTRDHRHGTGMYKDPALDRAGHSERRSQLRPFQDPTRSAQDWRVDGGCALGALTGSRKSSGYFRSAKPHVSPRSAQRAAGAAIPPFKFPKPLDFDQQKRQPRNEAHFTSRLAQYLDSGILYWGVGDKGHLPKFPSGMAFRNFHAFAGISCPVYPNQHQKNEVNL